jgi:hypothetical protein
MNSHFKYANYGVLVAMIIMFGGGFIFRNAGDGAIQAVTAVSFISAIVTHNVLEELAVRRRSRESLNTDRGPDGKTARR